MKRLWVAWFLVGLLSGAGLAWAARQAQVPGTNYANETGTRQALIPGGDYLNDTGGATGSMVLYSATLSSSTWY